MWKFQLELSSGSQQISMPDVADVVHFEMQGEKPCIWAHVDPNADRETRYFSIYGTGHPIPDDLVYHKTCQHGQFVWHLFEAV